MFVSVDTVNIGVDVNVMIAVPKERTVFLREHASKAYTTTSYFISKTVSDLPYAMVFPALFCTIVYWMVGYGVYMPSSNCYTPN